MKITPKKLHIILPSILIAVVLSACNSSNEKSELDDKDKPTVVKSNEQVDKDLLGKTVDEYKEIVTAKEKSADAKTAKNTAAVASYDEEIEKGFLPLKWEGLIAPGFDADSILAKYENKISVVTEGSREAKILYEKMQAEYNKAPPNDTLANKKVSIPGFIAPLEQSNGIITEFLLVPYFGACIHQPAPPANQTVHVKTGPDSGIRAEDAYDPIWVSGELLIDKSTTDIGTASYKVQEATIKKYDVEN